MAVKTTGTVVELRKRPGDRVAKGEVVALIESREIAETKGRVPRRAPLGCPAEDPLRARQGTLGPAHLVRAAVLRSLASYRDLQVKENAARRKLSFLGLGPAEIDALPTKPEAQFERQEIRSPIAGRVVERRVDLGAAVGRDNLETELYSVVDSRFTSHEASW
ncbi:UNVERIFIED_CONTAM: efflux RND transporter periplasmic adaptor subunit [Methylobacteriaceae bacterium AG10]|nr:efflux RND transporter periplasmic adaptor subunit [Methylobacteriaceae bacterium AG10]